jgi:hypothetical protein
MRDSNLIKFSEKIQARHLLGARDDSWRSEVMGAVDRVGQGEGMISFLLDGLPAAGGGPAKALAAAMKEHPDRLGHTQWELLQLANAGLMDKVHFYRWNRRLGDWGRVE